MIAGGGAASQRFGKAALFRWVGFQPVETRMHVLSLAHWLPRDARLRLTIALGAAVFVGGIVLLNSWASRSLMQLHLASQLDAEHLGGIFLLASCGGSFLVLLAMAIPLSVAQRRAQERTAAEDRVRFLAHHDPLTELPNRTMFDQGLQAALSRARREDSQVAVFMLDLDHFKDVNDTLGHSAGDELLRRVAARLRAVVRTEDLVARFGGDEFVVVQAGLAQPEAASRLAERLLAALSQPYELDGHQVPGSTSIGVAIGPADGEDAETLLGHADIALYRAKGERRGSIRFFEPEMNQALVARRELEAELRTAVAEQRFALHFQPLYAFPGRQVVGFEALLRWNHPRLGQIAPAQFMPLAEETGLIVPLGDWILRTACREAARWISPYRLAVNLSAAQFRHGDIVGSLRQALNESGLPPARLELEITESLLLQDPETVMAKLAALRRMGVSIALDDFGTGHSSLSFLWRFPFDRLKIDRSFVRDMDRDPKVSAIIDTIIGLGRTLDVVVSAEGVETEAQARALAELGCNEGQGFLLGEPAPAAELEVVGNLAALAIPDRRQRSEKAA